MGNQSIAKVVAALALVAWPLAAAAQSQDDAAVARRLVGMWRLVGRTVSFADGTTRPDAPSTSYLVYSDTGLTCYIAMDPTRAQWKSDTTPTPEEAVAGIVGLGAYCGTFRVNATEGSVVHTMEVERIPNWIGRVRKRYYSFQDEDHLILKIDAGELSPSVVERRLVWERVKPRPELTRR